MYIVRVTLELDEKNSTGLDRCDDVRDVASRCHLSLSIRIVVVDHQRTIRRVPTADLRTQRTFLPSASLPVT